MGLLTAGYGASRLATSVRVSCVTSIAGGLDLILLAAYEVFDEGRIVTVMAIAVIGLTLLAYGISLLFGRIVLAAAATIATGLTVTGYGVIVLHYSSRILGAAFIGVGVAAMGFGIVRLGRVGVIRRVRNWIAALTQEPPTPASSTS